ncbi:MAG: hypothetical protein ABIT76_01905 [Chthoniobacterales bacterium]
MAARTHIFAFILLGLVCANAAEPIIPQGYAPERYERIWKKSPFTVASVIAAEPVNNTTFADSLTLAGLLTIDGKPLVTVVANDSQETQLVEADKPNAAGLQVVSFVNNLDPTKVEVVLKKGDATGTLHFVINETPAPPPDQPNGGQPPRVVQPRLNNNQNIPNPSQPRVLPRATGPVMPMPGGPQIIRRRQLQLPGANRPNQPTRPNSPKANVIPPP